MKTNRKNLNDLLTLLKDIPPARPGMTSEEIRSTLGSASMTGSAPHGNIFNRRTSMAAIIVSILAGITTLYVTQNDSVTSRPPQPPAIAPAPQTSSALPSTGSSPARIPAEQMAPASTPLQQHAPYGDARVHDDVNISTDTRGMSSRLAPRPDTPKVRSAPVHQSNISGIRMLELTNEELARLDITVQGNEVTTYGEERFTFTDPNVARGLYAMGFDTTKPSAIVRMKVTAAPRAMSSGALPYNGADTISRIVPIIVASDWVKVTLKNKSEGSSVTYFDRSPLLELFNMTPRELSANIFRDNSSSVEFRSLDERNAMLANRLIGIRIHLTWNEKETAESGTAECMIWYFPTDEFVGALPDRYRIPLRKELDLLADVAEHKLEPGEVCQRLTGETFFEYCRKSSGALAVVSAYPNPSHGNVTCRISLTDRRSISFALYDISGKHLRDLTAAQWMEPGNHDISLKLEGARSGAYLIAMKTDKGEQVVQRVIVE
jgi:hypothetical protein